MKLTASVLAIVMLAVICSAGPVDKLADTVEKSSTEEKKVAAVESDDLKADSSVWVSPAITYQSYPRTYSYYYPNNGYNNGYWRASYSYFTAL